MKKNHKLTKKDFFKLILIIGVIAGVFYFAQTITAQSKYIEYNDVKIRVEDYNAIMEKFSDAFMVMVCDIENKECIGSEIKPFRLYWI